MRNNPRYNPKIHHRRSIRLKGYDYSRAGLYFITICCQDRSCFFGEIENGQMFLNDSGKMVEKWFYELENKFQDIKCHEKIVMPNHFHCIIENMGVQSVGVDLRVCPQTSTNPSTNADLNVGSKMANNGGVGGGVGEGEHIGSPLQHIIQWFKTMTTNQYIRGVKTLGWKPFNGKLWQRNYYEHIIRDEKSYLTISNYIIQNPAKWAEDKFHLR